mmetsp:Transcript_26231/g.36232  ORF Transcript_26231/g.36232 Transcript_26231/m.36232 type:complete len:117 (+) Transcript_26231:259-609(+)|eukprot:CAMPEP_0196581212 /NCGR_PEP_ID=MMETSP1081-20130531/32970_1 /TAXON_ID=36882 /ORGANISM="Pyramimonas amylifera, Strain CCMP720" /LENGTH=116 /DNA_ID=CAMNT_0041901351 /DNA_START=258 /DNA_END=608 /DNA_ORIENTATION=-
MGGKAKPTKHTAKELAGRAAASLQNKGGGKLGAEDRKGGVSGHSKFKCPICAQTAPSIKSMEEHHDSKHAKLPFEPDKCVNQQEGGVSTTQGLAVRGSVKRGTAEKKKELVESIKK